MIDGLAEETRMIDSGRLELPGMSLLQHLEELRSRFISVLGFLIVGFLIAFVFVDKLISFIQRPLLGIGLHMTMTHPTDAIDLKVTTALAAGAVIASPFILYQCWLFISPGMYAHEKRYVLPFMFATIGLFLGGTWFGYRYVLPNAVVFLIQDVGKDFSHVITVENYTSFFLAVILGLGITFELPIIMFFLSLFGIVNGKFFLKHFRYAVLIIFIFAAVLCPDPSPIGMCLFASPMLVLYFLGVALAFMVHSDPHSKPFLARFSRGQR